MQVFVTVKNVGIKINADVNVKNWLTNEYVTKDFFGILVFVNVNVNNLVMLENIWIIQNVSAGKSYLIS